jgi:hypothetical protein
MKKFILATASMLACAMTLSIAEEKKPEGKPGKEGADAKPKVSPEEAFKKLDKDADGAVSLDEFKASPRGKKDPAKAEEYFKKKDTDANGKLSLDEFKAKSEKKDGGKKDGEKKVEEKKAEPK